MISNVDDHKSFEKMTCPSLVCGFINRRGSLKRVRQLFYCCCIIIVDYVSDDFRHFDRTWHDHSRIFIFRPQTEGMSHTTIAMVAKFNVPTGRRRGLNDRNKKNDYYTLSYALQLNIVWIVLWVLTRMENRNDQ